MPSHLLLVLPLVVLLVLLATPATGKGKPRRESEETFRQAVAAADHETYNAMLEGKTRHGLPLRGVGKTPASRRRLMANPHRKYGLTALHLAAFNGDVAAVRTFVAALRTPNTTAAGTKSKRKRLGVHGLTKGGEHVGGLSAVGMALVGYAMANPTPLLTLEGIQPLPDEYVHLVPGPFIIALPNASVQHEQVVRHLIEEAGVLPQDRDLALAAQLLLVEATRSILQALKRHHQEKFDSQATTSAGAAGAGVGARTGAEIGAAGAAGAAGTAAVKAIVRDYTDRFKVRRERVKGAVLCAVQARTTHQTPLLPLREVYFECAPSCV